MTAFIQIAVEVVVHLAGFTNSLIIEDSVTILTATSTFILVSHAIPIVFFICVWRTFTSVTTPIRNLKFINHLNSICGNLGNKNAEITKKPRVPRKPRGFLRNTGKILTVRKLAKMLVLQNFMKIIFCIKFFAFDGHIFIYGTDLEKQEG